MVYLFIIVFLFALDFSIKQYVEIHFSKEKRQEILSGKIILRKVYNRGAALNFLEKKQEFVAGFSAALTALTFLAQLTLLPKKGYNLRKLGLSLLLGGALNNVYDRLVRKYVVDYFSFGVKWKKVRDVVFNLSDIFIFIGAFLIVISKLFEKDK